MRRRILASMMLVTLVAVVVFAVPLAFAASRIYRERAVGRLEREAITAEGAVGPGGLHGSDPIVLPPHPEAEPVALYDASGVLVAGVGPPHGGTEVVSALSGRIGNDRAQRSVRTPRNEPGEISRERAHRRRNGHVVVVEDHDQARIHCAGVVHRLVGHAGRHGAIADHANHVVGFAFQVPRHRHAETGGNGCRRMGRPETIVFAFCAFGETRQSSALTQRANAVSAPGQNLVRISLMAHIPDQPVLRRIEDVMQCDGQLYDAEARTKMPAADGGRPLLNVTGALAVAIAAAFGALGDSRAIAAACEGTARNPGAGGRIFTMLLLGLALIETLVLFTFLTLFLV